jgi:NAD(P)-dependent dehydrogenase (short-subunit alcohol dehydrogenase family)
VRFTEKKSQIIFVLKKTSMSGFYSIHFKTQATFNMCLPPKPVKPSQSVASKCTTIAAVVGGLLFVLAPCLLSDLVGGWTRKYTSPRPIFSTATISDLTGTVAIVTGANTGIGYHTALELARKGAQVIVAARSPTKGREAVTKILNEIEERSDNTRVRFLPLDLSSLKSVKRFAADFSKLGLPLNVLVLNAGVMKSPGAVFMGQNFTYGFDLTEEGFESHIGVNHIAHFYLTSLLRKKLVESAPSRVVSVSSSAEEFAYTEGMRFDLWKPKAGKMPADYEDGLAYGQSKLANLLFARELSSQLRDKRVTAYSCHPGVITTELGRYMTAEMDQQAKSKGKVAQVLDFVFFGFFNLALFGTADGALTQLQLATSPAEKLLNGAFYHPIGRVVNSSHPHGQNETLQKLLWEETERAIRSVV